MLVANPKRFVLLIIAAVVSLYQCLKIRTEQHRL